LFSITITGEIEFFSDKKARLYKKGSTFNLSRFFNEGLGGGTGGRETTGET
jgi:hypothetical protein